MSDVIDLNKVRRSRHLKSLRSTDSWGVTIGATVVTPKTTVGRIAQPVIVILLLISPVWAILAAFWITGKLMRRERDDV